MKKLDTNKKKLATNFISLSSVEVANYIFPLLTLPYLVRVVGPDRFGMIAFAQAFIQYFVIVTDYGFNFSATRNVSINRDNPQAISKIYSSVMLIKMILMFTCFAALLTIISFVPRFHDDSLIYIFSFGAVLNNVLFPVWLFQGLEKMRFVALLNLFAKTVFLLAVFFIIKKKDDYIYVPLISTLGSISAGFLSIYIVLVRLKIKFIFPDTSRFINDLKEGFHVFISTAAISIYTTSNTFILGLLTTDANVGFFTASEKIIKSVQRLFNPVSQTLYPHISKLVSDSRQEAVRFIKKLLIPVGVLGLVISIILFTCAKPIIYLFLGAEFNESVNVLRILSFIPFVISTASVIATLFLLGFGYSKTWSRIIVSASFCSLIFMFVYVYKLGLAHIGAAISWLSTETLILALSIIVFKRKMNNCN